MLGDWFRRHCDWRGLSPGRDYRAPTDRDNGGRSSEHRDGIYQSRARESRLERGCTKSARGIGNSRLHASYLENSGNGMKKVGDFYPAPFFWIDAFHWPARGMKTAAGAVKSTCLSGVLACS